MVMIILRLELDVKVPVMLLLSWCLMCRRAILSGGFSMSTYYLIDYLIDANFNSLFWSMLHLV